MMYIVLLMGFCQLAMGILTPLQDSAAIPYSAHCKSDGVQCKDSRTLVYCIGEKEAIQLNCPDINPMKPFCNQDKRECTEDPNTAIEHSGAVACGYDGYFPHPTRCHQYIQCENGVAYTYTCKFNFTYDHLNQSCSFGARCYPFSLTNGGLCQGKAFQWVTYPDDESMFAYCNPVQDVKIIVCLAKHYNYDPNLKKCEFKCTTIGHFADPLNPHGYYVCNLVGNKWLKYHLGCPGQMKFSPKTNNCALED